MNVLIATRDGNIFSVDEHDYSIDDGLVYLYLHDRLRLIPLSNINTIDLMGVKKQKEPQEQ